MKIGKYNIQLFKNATTEKVYQVEGYNFGYSSFDLLTNLKFARVILSQILTKIISGMSGVVWTSSGTQLRILQSDLKIKFEKHFVKIFKAMFENGFCVIAIDYKKQDTKILCSNDYIISATGTLILKDETYNSYKLFFIYSDNYMLYGESDYCICKDSYKYIDNLKNCMNSTTENMGAMGILSPESQVGVMSEFSKRQRREAQENYQKHFGLKAGKWSILITRVPTKFQQISLPIKDLQLGEQLKNAIMELAGFHGVPYELLPISGNSTFTNREEARIGELLNITCRSYANKMFDCAKEIFLMTDVTMTYAFENAATTEQISKTETQSAQ